MCWNFLSLMKPFYVFSLLFLHYILIHNLLCFSVVLRFFMCKISCNIGWTASAAWRSKGNDEIKWLIDLFKKGNDEINGIWNKWLIIPADTKNDHLSLWIYKQPNLLLFGGFSLGWILGKEQYQCLDQSSGSGFQACLVICFEEEKKWHLCLCSLTNSLKFVQSSSSNLSPILLDQIKLSSR